MLFCESKQEGCLVEAVKNTIPEIEVSAPGEHIIRVNGAVQRVAHICFCQHAHTPCFAFDSTVAAQDSPTPNPHATILRSASNRGSHSIIGMVEDTVLPTSFSRNGVFSAIPRREPK